MGIKGLSKLLSQQAPDSLKEHELKNYTGRKIAIDASMAIYQFLVAVRSSGADGQSGMLTNDAGEVTSHLMGTFYRTIRLMDKGIKPVYVFDGAAPTMKGGELEKRRALREKAAEAQKKAEEEGDQEAINKFQKRQVRMTKQHTADCIKLLGIMGVPVVQAPGEAEAQCAELVKAGKVWAMASEDMDSLTFGASRLLRRLTFPESRKMPVLEIHVDKVLEGMDVTMDQFIDICILCGCDYTDSIRGIGPKKAFAGIQKHGSIEKFVATLDQKKYDSTRLMPTLDEVRKLFKAPVATPGKDVSLEWKDVDEAALIQFLCVEKGFNEDRIRSGITRLKKAKKKGSQKRIDTFFSFKPAAAKPTVGGKKRKGPGKDSGKKKKQTKKNFFSARR
jgi:flap endonuclease-1